MGGDGDDSPAVGDSTDYPNDSGIEEAPGTDETGEEPDASTLLFSPNGGAFIDSVEVTLTVEGAALDIEYCLAEPDESECSLLPYSGPIRITGSTILHGRMAGAVEDEARAFVSAAGELSSFNSNIPVMIVFTEGEGPRDTVNHVPVGLVVLEPAEGANVGVFDPPVDSGRGRMRVRGSSSADAEKKPYDLELWEASADDDRSEALFGLPSNGDWALYAPYYFDDALIRNSLAYGLSNDIGRYGPRTAFFELYLAQFGQPVRAVDYRGVYVLVEEVERDEDRVNVTEILPEDIAVPEVTGGYIVKIDRVGDGEAGFSAGTANGQWDFQQTFVAVYPNEQTLERAQETYLRERLNGVGWALAEEDLTDPQSGLRYDEMMEVDSFIDHHIVNVLLKNPDSFRLSGYMYQDRGGLLNAGPVWDFDRSAASPDGRAADPRWWDNQNVTTDCTDVWEFGWYKGLFDIPEFRDRYWSRFESLLLNEYSADNLDARIVGLAEGLDEPAARNRDRWGAADFQGEIAELRVWFRDRHAWMLGCIQTYEDPRDCPG